MKLKFSWAVVGALIGSAAFSLSAPESSEQITLVTTFDYPKSSVQTMGTAIANTGVSAGQFVLPVQNRRTHSFTRTKNGHFSKPISYPSEQFTYVEGINATGTVCGNIKSPGFHGFFYDGSTYTQYDFPGAEWTFLQGENDQGDFVGYCFIDSTGYTAFANIGGTTTTFAVPGSSGETYPSGINNLGQIVGYYIDENGVNHGFFRDADGTLTFPIDFPDTDATYLTGINDKGIIVGNEGYSFQSRAFVLQLPNNFITYTYPGAETTTFTGINNGGLISGSHADQSSYASHGLIVRFGR